MSQQNRIVEQSFDRCAVASLCTIQLREKVGRFVGSIMNHHGIKKGGLEQLAQPLKQVQVDDQSTHPSIHQSFVASGRCIEPDAPALWSSGGGNSGIEPFGTGGDTHTAPLRGARVKHLNSHLKSLRNKRKERQKEQR